MGASEEIELQDARDRALAAVPLLPAVETALDLALGRVLREELISDSPLPGFDSSAMDGFAVRAADVAGADGQAPVRLRVVDESRAGYPAAAAVGEGQAIAISTGAALPDGADAIVRVESTARDDGAVAVLAPVSAGADVRRAGEDVRAGHVVLRSGTWLGPAQLGMLAALGRASALCSRRPRVSVLATGDELRAGGPAAADRAGAGRGIVRDSNSHTLAAQARGEGAAIARRETVPDSEQETTAAISRAAAESDLLVISGGVSVGAHDHVRPSLERLGAEQVFWGLALKPGHPTWFGTLGGIPVFALPGNPVSAMVTFTLLVAPALRAMQGAGERSMPRAAVLEQGYSKPAGRTHAIRCRLEARRDGWHATPTGAQGSHVLSSMLEADALAIIPGSVTELQAGSWVTIEPLGAWALPDRGAA